MALLGRVREMALGAYAHQDLPFDRLVEELQPERDLSRNPLFQLMFVLQNAPRAELDLPGIKVDLQSAPRVTARFDLTLSIVIKAEGLQAKLEYNSDLFDAATVGRLAGHFRTLLEGILADPDQPVGKLPILSEAERKELLVDWNATSVDYPKDRTIHQLVEEQTDCSPDAVAVIFENQQLTYRELNDRSNELANYLSLLGVSAETLVGIFVERSPDMVIGLLGILKAGGAYVPMDPTYPKERLAFMLEDIQAPIILTQQRLLEHLPKTGASVICLDEDWQTIARLTSSPT
jgi:non-ribosomal peptide synthetase component F